MMSDAQNATEQAVYTALAAAGLAFAVYQHVPEQTPPPVNIIGDLSGEPLDIKQGDGDERIDLTITTVVQGEQRKPVLEEQQRITDALHETTLTSVAGWTINPIKTSASAVLMPDGETYLGTTTFSIFALKN
jgi:hypothetical protein